MTEFRQAWSPPTQPRPIIFIGGGAIVRTSHLPAYRRLGLPVAGVYDVDRRAAGETASQHGIRRVFDSLREAAAAGAEGAVFDVAVPANQILGVLEALPLGAPVLIQKPMGATLADARDILRLCRERHLVAALNFQLRFSPGMLVLRDMVANGALGELTDIEVRLQVRQPWESWSFLRHAPRVEILYHSIHYLDAIRLLAGEPAGVYCRAVGHPELPDFSDPRSTTILDYGERLRCSLTLNHTHGYGPRHRASIFKVEGTGGAAIYTMGVNLEYPSGSPDSLEWTDGEGWEAIPLRGSWFPEAFEGPMSNVQRFIAGEDAALISPVDDAIRTMAVVEACYESSAAGGTPVPRP